MLMLCVIWRHPVASLGIIQFVCLCTSLNPVYEFLVDTVHPLNPQIPINKEFLNTLFMKPAID